MTKPYTPHRAALASGERPAAVVEVFNALLGRRYDERESVVITEEEVVKALLSACPHLTRHEIYERKWLDGVAPLFRRAGWTVRFDKPGFNEIYGAFWEFTPKRGGR